MRKYVLVIAKNIEEIITVFFLGVMCFFVFLQITFRYLSVLDIFSRNPILYSEELARYCYVWITFIGLSLSTKHNENITMSFLLDNVSDNNRLKHYLLVFIRVTSIIMFSYLLIWSINYVNFMKIIISPALEIPMTVMTISMPLGFFLTIVRLVQKVIEK